MLNRMCISVLLMVISFSAYPADNIRGTYAYEYKGEKLIDGTTVFIYWAFNFIDDRTVNLSVTSWHALFRCDGNYHIQKNKNKIYLVYSDDNESECDEKPPQFVIKGGNGKHFVKSPLFHNDVWHPLEKPPGH